MKTADFDYQLPTERIAQHPVEPRDSSRLMRLDRQTGQTSHHVFRDLPQLLQPGDLVVRNRTKVIPARLSARKLPGGGRLEVLLLERLAADTWKCMIGGKGMKLGRRLELPNGIEGEIIGIEDGPQRLIQFSAPLDDSLENLGEMPLPPYIHERLEEQNRYQTIFAQESGSAAAPTAGLHFTDELFDSLSQRGIGIAEITLHIGLDTFAPVREEEASTHTIHSEWCRLSAETAEQIRVCKQAGGRVIALGTTSVRTLESAAAALGSELIAPFEGRTELFILPGFQFKITDAMITNFHLPRSTLIMMVSAFAGRELVLKSYQQALQQEYRFYSFGDAMLIV